MKNLKEKLEKKIDTVIRQYDKERVPEFEYREHPYIPILEEIKQELFSDDLNLKKKAIKRLESLLLSYRAWEDKYGTFFSDQGDKYQDKFVDDFKNWDEWYGFLESIVEDAKEYVADYESKYPNKN